MIGLLKEVTHFIEVIGFPIFVCLYFIIRFDKRQERILILIEKMADKIGKD